jgi:hypothetical protein
MEGDGEQGHQPASPSENRTAPAMRSRTRNVPMLSNLWVWKGHILELALIIGAYVVYLLTRGLVFSDLDVKGLENAGRVISLEKSLGFFWEPGWQSWTLDNAKGIATFLNWVYIVTYWPVIMALGLVLYATNRPRYHYYRTVVLITLVFALIVFMLFPVASPFNMTAYFVNTIQELGPSIYGGPEMATFYNSNAAMPSLHFSWTVILGVVIVRTFSGWIKLLGMVYPVLTFFAITITANHFIVDAMAGGLLSVIAFAIMELGIRRPLIPTGRVLPSRGGPRGGEAAGLGGARPEGSNGGLGVGRPGPGLRR